ncbi:hypothetical protein BPAE_0008g00710 [Botrytis paeoniae]|uniref:Fungal N-terminal domain-containing protein n=1 Tax=Botrytis paeoniae TaxID=278948 RepID=A0A4Z1G4S1_9HELO|nr:hypothetical protein BPAE_0008g00710 [Botrytis paeoniae]
MEVPAGVSSVISILSLTSQLADGIKKACALWESIQEASQEVEIICKDLRAISNVFDDIRLEENQFMQRSSSIAEALGLCSEHKGSYKDGEATRVTVKIELRENDLGFGSPELFQLVSMVDEIRLDLQQLTSETIETTSRDPPDSNVHFDALKVQARTLTRNVKNPGMRLGIERAMDLAFAELTNPAERGLRGKFASLDNVEYSLSSINTPFGTLNIRITTLSFEDNTYKMRTNLIIHPSRFSQLCGVNFGFRIALSNSYGAFKHELKAYRAVPDDAAIFRLCREGQIDVIQHLFDEGLASPLDTDSFGRTLLMDGTSLSPSCLMAASAGNISTCKFLVNEGADLEVRDMQNNDLGSFACGTWAQSWGKNRIPSHAWSLTSVSYDVRIKTIRMFIEQYKVSEDLNPCGVSGMRRLSSPHYLVAAHRRGTGRDIFYWTASMLQDQLILTSTLHFNFWSVLYLAMRFEDTDVIDYLFRSCPCNITKDWVTCTVGNRLMLKMRESDQALLLRCMISQGMDLHSLFIMSPSATDECQQSTVMTLALRSSAAFFNFKTTLKNLDINILQFVCDEMQ